MENITKDYEISSVVNFYNKDEKIIQFNKNNFYDIEKNIQKESLISKDELNEIFVPDWKLHEYVEL